MQFSTPNVCEPLIDLVIDNYRLLEVVGQGGMGCVYRARDEKMGRIVALKLLRNNLGAFTLREGKALGQLNHPNIVNVFYMGESREGVFIVMEFVDGGTLHEYMNNEVTEVIPVMKQALLALEHAHEAGVIHRDIKPSNIMVSKAGQVKVMDFGLAKVESPDKDRTVTRLQAGTISYMSPEQVRGLQHVSQLSDIYSLGKSFYHILARRLPFDASESDQYSILKAIIEKQFKPPSHFNKTIPRGLDRIIMKAIEKEPSHRYKSAREMYEALEAFEAREYPRVVHGYSRKPAYKHSASSLLSRFSFSRKQWALGLAAVFTFMSISAFATWYTNRDTQKSLAEQTHTTLPIEAENNSRLSSGSSIPIGANDTSGEPARNSNQGSSSLSTTATVSILSSPANSNITVGNTRLQAPVNEHPFEFGDYLLIVDAEGYETYSKIITLTSDTTLSVNLQQQGRLIVEASIPGAFVRVNGRSMGRTPINRPMAKGSYMVVVSAQGYSTYSSQVQVETGNNARIVAPLQQQGLLQVRTTPEADIFIDNSKQLRPGQSDLFSSTLTPGTHQLRISHPEYGTWEKNITVRKGEQTITVDFTQHVQANIGANVFGASIYIDGVQAEEETPARLTLGVGIRRIEVRKDGFTSDPPFIDQLVEGSEEAPLQFAFVLTKEQ